MLLVHLTCLWWRTICVVRRRNTKFLLSRCHPPQALATEGLGPASEKVAQQSYIHLWIDRPRKAINLNCRTEGNPLAQPKEFSQTGVYQVGISRVHLLIREP